MTESHLLTSRTHIVHKDDDGVERTIPLDRANGHCEELLQSGKSIGIAALKDEDGKSIKVDTSLLKKLQAEVAEEQRVAAEKAKAEKAKAEAAK
jgi:hypothetical protein